jgi:hypothetical protein
VAVTWTALGLLLAGAAAGGGGLVVTSAAVAGVYFACWCPVMGLEVIAIQSILNSTPVEFDVSTEKNV